MRRQLQFLEAISYEAQGGPFRNVVFRPGGSDVGGGNDRGRLGQEVACYTRHWKQQEAAMSTSAFHCKAPQAAGVHGTLRLADTASNQEQGPDVK